MLRRRLIFTCLFLLCGAALSYAATIDSGTYTTYTTNDAKTTLSWVVCGAVGPASGCFDSGTLGPFGKIGSVVEGFKTYDLTKGTVTRSLYVIDQAFGSSQNEVALHAYRRVDTITSSFDMTTFTLVKTVTLPLTGGISAHVFVAANGHFLVVGSSLTTVPVEVAKMNFAVTMLGIIGEVPTAITADNYGYVTVTSANGFFVIGPDGSLQEDGGGSPSTVNAVLGIQP